MYLLSNFKLHSCSPFLFRNTENTHFHACVHATESRDPGKKARSEVQTNIPLAGALRGFTIEDSPQATTTSTTLLPFRGHRARSLRLSSRGCLIVSIDPSSISNLKLHIAALAPGLWDFMRAKAVYCAGSPTSCFSFHLPNAMIVARVCTRAAWRNNNIDTPIEKFVEKRTRE